MPPFHSPFRAAPAARLPRARLRSSGACLLAAALLAATALPQSSAPQESGFDQAHSAWSALLAEHVHEGGLVDYNGLAKRRAELDGYLAALEAVSTAELQAFSQQEHEAFWINAYNAHTVQLILDHAPVDSIRDIGGLFRSVFSKRFVPLQHLSRAHEEPLSLGEIEHEILAKVSRQPLFHFAIVCASASCPELRPEAYTAPKLDEQLVEQARAFLADATKNDTAPRGRTLRISKIFDWGESELEQYPGGIKGLLGELGPPRVRSADLGKLRIKYRDYDWSLNAWHPEPSNR